MRDQIGVRCALAGRERRAMSALPPITEFRSTVLRRIERKKTHKIRKLAEENLLLYATGSKAGPCLSLYDAGEGQLAENFGTTFCSLISGSAEGSYIGSE